MALADVFQAVAGPDAPVEFQAYDGSKAGAESVPPGQDVPALVPGETPWNRSYRLDAALARAQRGP